AVFSGDYGHFEFREISHEPGPKTLLGKTYSQSDKAQGEAVLRDLSRHRSTANFIATKLARHFIADEPPAKVVDQLARVFLATDGHLPSVYEALIDRHEAWEQPLAKLKNPNDYVVSSYRALGVSLRGPQDVLGPLRQLKHPPFTPGSPAGWPDTAVSWGGEDALLKRIEWAVALGKRTSGQIESPLAIANDTIGPIADQHTLLAIERAASAAQALALLFSSPEFQQR
ncbi:MAG: DUF1800 family protein, partial [Gammaproteobacteria bacterium]|nr:DUF1800 family protein [Gammaproteobacteria bacterium]